jgi:hypothetical protein
MRATSAARGFHGQISLATWGNGRTPEVPTPQVKAEYLSLIDIFRELPTDEITRLAVDLPKRTYSSGAVIYAPGEQSDVLFLLKRAP